ncbi:efflux RND transporter permease subunit, partial [Moorena bouillonii]
AGDHLEAMLSEVGRIPEDDRTIRDEQTEENTARILVRLAAGGPSGTAIVERVAPVVAEMSGIEASWEVGASALSQALGTSGPPIEIEIAGQSLENLRSGAAEVRQALAERAQLWNVRSSFEGGPPELRVRLEQTLADGLGIDIAAVGAAIESSLDGRKVTTLALGDEERDVMLRLPGVRMDELHRIPMTTSSGARLAVGDVAVFEHHEGAREVFRRDQRRIALVTARIAPGYEYPEAMAAAREVLAEVGLPGMRAELTGEEEERIKTFGELQLAGILAIVLLFMVLAGTFESLIHPLTVVMSVPLASIGVAAVLVPRGYPIGVMEALGLIVLAGVAVNDAILLVGTARRLMGEGLERNAALARAAALRLRPILMTTATTALALIPLAVGASESARLRSPLALTIIGGIVASTLGCLLVIPCIYSVLDRVGRLGRR